MSRSVKEEKDARIQIEVKRLNTLLKKIPKEKLRVADGLIQRVAFMRITLEDLEADINENGTTEFFSQSEGVSYERERPAAKMHNSIIKNYTTSCKQLIDLLSADGSITPKKAKPDEFEKILGRGKVG